jgi:hypothetical protein
MRSVRRLFTLSVHTGLPALTIAVCVLGTLACGPAHDEVEVNPAVERAYLSWTGIAGVTADCGSDPTGDGKGWRCTIESARGADERCYAHIKEPETDPLTAQIRGCESDVARVNLAVERAYLTRSGLANARADCFEAIGDGWGDEWQREGSFGSRPCVIAMRTAARDSDYCHFSVTGRDRGRLRVRIISCRGDASG